MTGSLLSPLVNHHRALAVHSLAAHLLCVTHQYALSTLGLMALSMRFSLSFTRLMVASRLVRAYGDTHTAAATVSSDSQRHMHETETQTEVLNDPGCSQPSTTPVGPAHQPCNCCSSCLCDLAAVSCRQVRAWHHQTLHSWLSNRTIDRSTSLIYPAQLTCSSNLAA